MGDPAAAVPTVPPSDWRHPALLAPAELDALGRLRLRVRRRVRGGGVGAHRARGHGASLDFDDYRPYQPGDDPRRVDPHAHRRLGRLLVKLYEAEDDVGLQLVLDASASMTFGTKATAACRVAAALAVVAAHGGDRVRLVVVDADVSVGPWRRGRHAVGAILADLDVVHRRLERRPEQPVPLPAAERDPLLRAVHRALPESHRGPLLVVSDLLVPTHDEVIGALAAASGGAALVHLLDAEDLDPDVEGDPRLIDVDYGTVVHGAATGEARSRFSARRDAWLADVAGRARAADVAVRRHVGAIDTTELLALLPATGVLG